MSLHAIKGFLLKGKIVLRSTPSRTRIDMTHNQRMAKLYMDWAVKHLDGVLSVLDVGAGDGAAADALPQGTDYSGIDIGADIYARTGRVKYIEDFPGLRAELSAHKAADFVALFDVLEHTDDFVTLFRDGLKKASKFVFVSLPNEMNLEMRVRFLFGKPIPAHGLCMIDAKLGHKHQWLITYPEAKEILTKTAADLGFVLTHEVFIRNLPKTTWKRIVVRLLSLPFPDEIISHGLGFVFCKHCLTFKEYEHK
ncbi:MAG: hypothetical protein JW902_16820 [Syntrophaceae bacterium]|nr:hypothetical protein [Syntrophaceae bacterium]